MSKPLDLSGRWSGVYFYPNDPIWNPDDVMPATTFNAELVDSEGRVSGTVVEPDNLYCNGSRTIPSVVDGSHDGRTLRFAKFSEAEEGYESPIHYEGAISADGLTVDGSWSIPGDWSGTFRMQRQSGADRLLHVERTVEAKEP
jgi:hypothetical protein